MKYLILAYIVAAGIGLWVWKSVIPNLPKPPEPPANVDSVMWKRGRALYNTRCISCHNSNPDQRGSVAPALRGVSEELLRERLKNGKGGMPAFPQLERHAPAFREYLK